MDDDIDFYEDDELIELKARAIHEILTSSPSDEKIRMHGEMLAKMNIMQSRHYIKKKQYRLDQLTDDLVEDGKIPDNNEIDSKGVRYSLIYADSYNHIIVVIIVSALLIEEFTIDLMKNEFFSDEYSGSQKTDDMARNMSQSFRENLLLRTGVLDKELRDDISEVRILRNNIVHESEHSSLFTDINNITKDLDHCIDAMESLEQRVYGEELVERIGIRLEENDI